MQGWSFVVRPQITIQGVESLTIFLTVKRYTAIMASIATISVIVLLIGLIPLAGCGEPEDIHTRIYRKYSQIESFSAVLEVTVTSENTINTYTVRQYFVLPDNFREEVLAPENLAGMTYVFANGAVTLSPPVDSNEISLNVPPNNRNYTFLPEFFERYFNSDNAIVAVSVDESNADIATILEVLLDGDSIYRASQKLWICNETLQPLKLETYNANGDVLISAVFTEFELNAKIDTATFDAP